MSRAATNSRSWRCPYDTVRAYRESHPTLRAIPIQVDESSPPERTTTAPLIILLLFDPTSMRTFEALSLQSEKSRKSSLLGLFDRAPLGNVVGVLRISFPSIFSFHCAKAADAIVVTLASSG